MFLTLVGLTALGVGGVGAGQAIDAFLDRKRDDIAILKSMGAGGAFMFLIFFLQVMAWRCWQPLLGAAIGALLPFAVVWLYGDSLPSRRNSVFIPAPLLLALAFGLLSAMAFAVPPLCAGPQRSRPPACSATWWRRHKRKGESLSLRSRPVPRS